MREVRKEFRWYYYFIICVIAGIGAYFTKHIQISNFLTLAVSAIVFFGIYFSGLILIEEPVVVDVLNGIKKKLKKGK